MYARNNITEVFQYQINKQVQLNNDGAYSKHTHIQNKNNRHVQKVHLMVQGISLFYLSVYSTSTIHRVLSVIPHRQLFQSQHQQ